ncbi:MAG: acetyltransferase [Alphaproteobacteria bacterium]
MTLPVIVIGGGGHARVVIDALLLQGRAILGVCDPALVTGAPGPFGLDLLGGDDAIAAHAPDAVRLANGVGAPGAPGAARPQGTTQRRRAVFEAFGGRGYGFVTVVHPSAVIGHEVALGEGAQVMAGAVVQTGARIGLNAILNTGCRIDHDCRIGDHAHVAPGAVLSGDVTVEDDAFVGAGASVIQGMRIGRGAIVGAGTVVVRDVPAGARIVTPASRTLNGVS